MFDHITPRQVTAGPGRAIGEAVVIKPAGVGVNPSLMTGSSSDTLYVLYKLDDKRTRPTRVVSTKSPSKKWKIGTVFHVQQHATLKYLGKYMVVGVIDCSTGDSAGEIPDRKIMHSVVIVS